MQPARSTAMALVLVVGLAVGHAAEGPTQAPPAEDFLDRFAATYRFRLGTPGGATPTPDGGQVLFLRSPPRSFVRDLYELDVVTGEERVLLTATSILKGAAEELSVEEKARRERTRTAARGIASFELSRDGRRILVPLSGRLFVIERETGAVTELPEEGGVPLAATLSPDGSRVACVRAGELHVIEVATGVQRRLSEGAGEHVENGLAEFVAQEEMGRMEGFWWSPDSQRLLYQRTDTSGVETLTIHDPTHPEAEANRFPYPRAGKANARVQLGWVDAGGGETTWIDWRRGGYEYLAGVRWEGHGPLTLVVQDRAQETTALLGVDLSTGQLSTLLLEKDDAWVGLDRMTPYWLPADQGFLWQTDRRGRTQLELRDPRGALLQVVTAPELGLRHLVRVDPGRREVWVRAGPDPTRDQLYRVPLDPSKGPPVAVTRGDARRFARATRESPLVVTSEHFLEGPAAYRVLDAEGRERARLRSVAEDPGLRPELEFVTVSVEDREHHAVLIRPRDATPGRRYPVIVDVYGGPGVTVVSRAARWYLLEQWMADHGFVLVSIDGRGTPGRGRAWERAIDGDLASAPLEDQVAVLTELGARYPELDLSRVGIFGWSFGGYLSAMAALRRPDVFHAAVAGAPVADWADYDTHYTERYLGHPEVDPEAYRRSSLLTYAAELRRPLLVIHGTGDDNVYFTHSLRFTDALFRAGKDFDFLPLAGFTHMVPDPLVTRRLYGRILDHFRRHLGAAVPPGR